MSVRQVAGLVVGSLAALLAAGTSGQSPIQYRFTFPEPEHRWMQVEATFPDLGDGPLELRMSRSSPGRYAIHDFAKNVYDVRAYADDRRELPVVRSDPHGWTVAGHGGEATIEYKVFGDRVDGTYLAVDATHAHINMPAAVMWAKGLDDRPARLAFEAPAGRAWRIATQLFPGGTPFEFTAPNLQYLMDSPVEFGPVRIRQFTADGRTIRVAVHHNGSDGELDAYVRGVEQIVREQREIFGEYPQYEPGHYTFIADYLPYAVNDAMEHRNSTVLTSSTSMANGTASLLQGVAHEFFHGWNVERIRPLSLEPFDFERANMSGELWLAEGFTEYFGPLVMTRAGLMDMARLAARFEGFDRSAEQNPARLVRSAVEMSQMAPFVDSGQPQDPTNWSQTVISYYEFGGAIALALDLSLRDRSDHRVTLDHYMRAMWQAHGRPGGRRPGYVDRPYTIDDAEARLAEVSDAAFAREFFRRYVHGREAADYGGLLLKAGLVLRKTSPGRPWLGDVRLDDRGGRIRVASPPPFGSPLYAAGLDVDDEIRQLDGKRIETQADVAAILQRHRPGDVLAASFVDRTGAVNMARITLEEDPRIEIVPIESSGGRLEADQRAFRKRWLN